MRASSEDSAFVGIWRQTGETEYTLKHRVELVPRPVGIYTLELDPQVRVERGDFLGVHYSRFSDSAVIASALPGDPGIQRNELYQTYNVQAYDDDIQVGVPIDLSPFSREMIRTTLALKANVIPDLDSAYLSTAGMI